MIIQQNRFSGGRSGAVCGMRSMEIHTVYNSVTFPFLETLWKPLGLQLYLLIAQLYTDNKVYR